MLERIDGRLEQPQLQELLSYAVFPDPQVLEAVIHQYSTQDHMHLYGYQEEGEWIGVIGCAEEGEAPYTLRVRHLAITPAERGKGYGRGILLELLETAEPAVLLAEADDEGAEFYRNIGFTVIGNGELNAASERYICRYDVEEDDE
ncbi:GNAT family N-acetyltransferase [Paenibacillus sp. PK4536]|uniref:N-acetyltransferase domain-containing protein n=1 Tax=Paenibacillus nuruki TaxID=1886670 RepID=A0A1E3L7L5_9BACL|nr:MULTISPECIES: GNAT family N-acetyltransferase [Paenibacillus]ODP29746.1 hypothetical protein PTI45_00900 [Paenibacillus nuruki]WIM37705.1 GNAT family N-acetyltransferase [Paenibacillus sp. PK4536]CAJ1315651.1 N-acetyltransferase domain-containing protein [Paenibacillus nuruki]